MARMNRDYLEPLTGAVKRKKFCVYDIESKADDTQKAGFTRPFMVATYDPHEDEYVQFRNEPHLLSRKWQERHDAPGGCIDKLLNYLLSPRFAGYNIYAHNGGSFDHLFLLAWLERHRDEFCFEVIPVQSSIQKIEVWKLPTEPEAPIKERWTFLDSMKLLPMGLERACQTFKLPGKVQHDLHMHEDDPHWAIYLQQDCEALANVLMKAHDLIETVFGGEVGMTTPATSMKLYRRQYLGKRNTQAKIPRHAHFRECRGKAKKACVGCCHEWVRRGYYGGRTEMFQTHGDGLRYYDINSSYPASMLETMPAGEREVTDVLDWKRYEHFAGFVECTVRIPKECYLPPLPHRHEKTGKLVFPTGVFTGVWSCEELRLLDHPSVKGEILHVKKVVWYRRKYLFKDMVEHLYEYRNKKRVDYDPGLDALAKLFLNGLYGKFGMKQDRTTVVFSRDVVDEKYECFLCGKEKREDQCVCNDCEGSTPANGDPVSKVWYQKKHVDASYIIPQIAAHITALSRVRIWHFMREALDKGGQLYYADTDSVITTAQLKSGTELGAMKDEYEVILKGAFVQPKVYMLEASEDAQETLEQVERVAKDWQKPKVKMKGFPRDMQTPENLARLRKGETLEWKRLEKVRTLARHGFKKGPEMAPVKKAFKSKYDKRTVLENGDTAALVLFEEPEWLREEAAQ